MAMEEKERLRSPSVWLPRDPGEAVRLKEAFGGDAVYVAGSTLLRTQWEAGTAPVPAHLIDLASIPGLDRIEETDDGLVIGSLARLRDCAAHPAAAGKAPLLVSAVKAIAGASVRNQATLGGNVVYRVGDSMPALLALDAELIWHDGRTEETIGAAEWLAGPSARPGILTAIRLPDRESGMTSNRRRWFAFHKVGRREAFVPSLVTVAIAASVAPDGTIADIRIAAGGGQTVPRRLTDAERLLAGRIPDAELLEHVYDAALEQYAPAPDPFAADSYRKRTAANLIAAELWKSLREPDRAGKGDGDASESID
ncbi:putative xanthine dehydrogenase subunit C [Cohnella xylanilytica]|uniref:FAD binding domain-containing protein n=1 Tax=Cohnella xylanilytica TaxID=557555 RepID=A0A841TWK7_9BACL|nr:FAD binding domain-containing protein [Cohnella xylanilytica]MBB6690341.1 FAD binding domain-containing protein [Cohnella xylanilytica]GIO10819.1 putative xanthine dehydrogenase subunit C [Cohnella xylanilytica]